MKALIKISISLLSRKPELFQGMGFFLKSFSMGDAGRPARGLADTPTLPGKTRIEGKGGWSS